MRRDNPMKQIRNFLADMSLYQKFALAIASLGLFPVLLVFPFLINRALQNNIGSINTNYQQAAYHISSTIENVISAYDTASQVIYHYTGENTTDILHLQYQEYDNLRQILVQGDAEERNREMTVFLRRISGII